MARRKSRVRNGSAPRAASTPLRRDMDSLIQGVSQQPPHLRAVGQGESQTNGWSSPLEGLTKRNAMRLQAKVLTTPIDDFYLEMMDVSVAESYSVFVNSINDSSASLTVRDQNTVPALNVHGVGMTLIGDQGVISLDNTAYAFNTPGDFYKRYVLINSGPLGLLLNREKITAYEDIPPFAQSGEGLVFVKAIAYDVTYTVSIDNTEVATYTTPKASDDDNTLSTSVVAESLRVQLDGLAAYTCTRKQYVLHLTHDSGTNFDLEIDDSRSQTLAVAFTDSAPSLAYLPIIGPNDYIVRIISDPNSTVDDRWLKFVTSDDSTFGPGAWSETLKPGIKYKLNKDTMPLVIYREAKEVIFIGPADGTTQTEIVDGTTYTYTFPEWGERTAGDEVTVPDPAFIGNAISDHLVFRSRYVLTAGETITFSETDDIFNFFLDTSLTVQDTDPFDLRATSERSSPLQYMIPIDDSIFVFSSTTQFQVTAADREVLTPLTGSIARLSNLEMNSNVRPKLAGAQVLFATNHYGYSHFREFSFFNAQNRRIGLNLGSSNDITNLVPKYIEGLVTHWDVGEAVDVAVAVSPTNKKELFVYKYLWENSENGTQKLQQSWSKWEFNQEIQWVRFMDNVLYLLVTDAEGTYFVVVLLDEAEVDLEPQIHLDRLIQYPAPAFANASVQATGSYDATTDKTTFTLPYTPANKAQAVVRFTGGTMAGLYLGETTTKSLVCSEKGDFTSGYDIAFGEPYTFQYQFNKAYVRDTNDTRSQQVGELAGRTQVTRWNVSHVDTGEYYIRVKRRNRSDDSLHHYRARGLNVGNNTLDTEKSFIANGNFSVPVCSRNTECTVLVESDSWLPTTITSASWEGLYSDRTKGMS